MKLNLLCPLAGLLLIPGLLLLSGAAAHAEAVKKAALPLVIYSEGGGKAPFIPSGYMGNTGAIKMNPACTVQPHSGKTCLEVDYTAKTNGAAWSGRTRPITGVVCRAGGTCRGPRL